MARKNLMKGLLETPLPVETPPAPRPHTGAVGAVSRSIADLKTRALVDLDPHTITAGGVKDRLSEDPAEHAALVDSIRTYGQQVPVLVRPHPDDTDSYQIVYGRRRVLALRDLGQPVRAMVRDLDDRDLILAQGQENTARRDLSFIEKVNFARQMAEAGYDRKVICDALSIDKTLVSRMLAVAEALPQALIRLIGAAPSVGRERWLSLAKLWSDQAPELGLAEDMLAVYGAESSDARFDVLHRWLTERTADVGQSAIRKADAKPTHSRQVISPSGAPLATVRQSKRATTLTFDSRDLRGFDQWVIDTLPDLHRRWMEQAETPPPAPSNRKPKA